MASNSDDLISRKTFLKLSGFAGLLMSVPFKKGWSQFVQDMNPSDTSNFLLTSGVGNHRQPNFVDVYYEFDDTIKSKDVPAEIEWAEGFWETAEKARKNLVCETSRYKAIANLEQPGIDALYLAKGDNILGKDGIGIEIEDQNGIIYSSRHSPDKARQNTWRAGLYYYDAHLLDFRFADKNGNSLPVTGEMVLNCFPDKIHVEAIFHVQGNCTIKRARLKCDLPETSEIDPGSNILRFRSSVAGIIGGKRKNKEIYASVVNQNHWQTGATHRTYLAFLPGKNDELNHLKSRIHSENNPLDSNAFEIENGVFKGYDPGKGFYRIKGTTGASAQKGFGGFLDNPNMYLSTGIEIHNSSEARSLYLMHESPAGPIEAGVLTDSYGFPLPVQVQACKNFGGEKEEKPDDAFSESYYPLNLSPGEKINFHSLHIHQNWGNHALRQLSSIRFFQIYYHLSQGVTETTCFSLPTKFGSIPSKEVRAYTLADYRPLSGQTWSQSPQHHHVALQGWLQYRDQGGSWRYPHYKGTTLLSVGPNLAWFIMKYVSSDGKVEQELEFFEMPQDDESRTFMRCRYHFKKPVTVRGNMAHNMRLINKGTYIRKLQWDNLSWRDPSGEIVTKSMTHDGEWSAEGIPLRPVNSFFCAYPHIDGNDGLIIRKVGGMVNGEHFQKVGFSAVGHKNGKTELMLVPLIEGNTIDAGSYIELDCLLMPYGDDSSRYFKPMEESIRFGLNQDEFEEFKGSKESLGVDEIIGPLVKVLHGKKVRNLPPVVETADNWAEFMLSGGHNRMAIVVKGFESPKLPMLWKGKAFMDPQVKGGDGYQIMENSDGTYSAIFVAPTWTTRVGHEWSTREETYFATQAVSEAEITEVSSLNGRVELNIEGDGETSIRSPRLWYPAVNNIENGTAVHTAKSKAGQIRTAPIDFGDSETAISFDLRSYSSEGFDAKVSLDNTATMVCHGLYPNTAYLLEVDGRRTEVASSKEGALELHIIAGRGQSLTCRYIK